ncbi:putative importin-5 [Iris pallida]|uniref:Importin-5 n=1 Tax=Iris pallida TaxID=29817 RepID=A0AAX6GHR6_IRIPA|nr:putative importin-5 [Iris pallida]KAJ6847736.1 putative importin-5 [Iris pallida]
MNPPPPLPTEGDLVVTGMGPSRRK